MISKWKLNLVLLVVGCAASSSVQATPVLFAVTQTGSLYSINQTTYVPSLVGIIPGTPSLIGLATEFASNRLFTFNRDASTLLQISSTDASIVPPTPTNLGMAATLNEGDLAFNPVSGTGYIASSAFPVSSFWSFTTSAGSGTQIRTCSTNPCADGLPRTFFDGIAFNAGGTTLYALQQAGANLYTINPATGVPALVGPTGIAPASYGLGALTRRPTDGVYFALLSNNSVANLFSIDVTTGVAVPLGPLGSLNTVTGLAFIDVAGPVPEVPEPATLWTMAAALLFAAVKKLREA